MAGIDVNKPLKGIHLVFNDEVTSWLREALRTAEGIYQTHLAKAVELAVEGEDTPGVDGKAVLRDLQQAGWTREDTNFGKKCYLSTPHPAGHGHHGEARVGVVLIKGKLTLDIRLWGEY